MQNTCEVSGTATLIGNWSQEAIDCFNEAASLWGSITDGNGFEVLCIDDFESAQASVSMSGEPNGLPSCCIDGEWHDWFYAHCKGEAPELHARLAKLMAQDGLSVFLYFLAEDEYEGECSGEVNTLLLVSDGKDLSIIGAGDHLRELMLRRQETGEYEIYEGYSGSWEDDEDYDGDEEDYDDEDYGGEEDEDGEEEKEDDNPWTEDDINAWDKGRTEDWLYDEIEGDGERPDSVSLARYIGPGGIVAVPAELDGKPVTAIAGNTDIRFSGPGQGGCRMLAGAFRGRTDVTSVMLPEGVTRIGSYAFHGCTGLSSIQLPEGLEYIGDWAFDGCTALEAVKLPDSVKEIGKYAFYKCRAMTTLELGKGLKVIQSGAFSDCTGLTALKLPENLRTIGDDAFQSCTGLTAIKIPGHVTSLEVGAFSDCTGLASVELPKGLKEFPQAFYRCTSLESVTIPPKAEAFEGAFERSGLKSVVVSEGVETISEAAFAFCGQLKHVDLPDSLKNLEEGAFARCVSLELPQLPQSLESVADSAFFGCTAMFEQLLGGSLEGCDYDVSASYDTASGVWRAWSITGYHGTDTEIAVPTEVAGHAIERIAPEAFSAKANESCKNLKKVTISEGIDILYPLTFLDCVELEEVILPESLTDMGEEPFKGCEKLKHLTIPAGAVYFDLTSIPDEPDFTLYAKAGSAAYNFAKANWKKLVLTEI